MRAVLLIGAGPSSSPSIPSAGDVHVAAYAPHSLIFPRAAVVVHQGGIGTLAQALRSGRPQLIVPFYADQADNAARTVRLGVARSLPPRRYVAGAAARELAHLAAIELYQTRAADVRRTLEKEDGAERAADFVMNRLSSRVPACGVPT